jgi:hypothetical protein
MAVAKLGIAEAPVLVMAEFDIMLPMQQLSDSAPWRSSRRAFLFRRRPLELSTRSVAN